jgi:long-chain acyl-CoA synthetase
VGDETLARVFWSRVETSGDRPAQMTKAGGRWRTLTWSEVGTVVRELALGLLALGRRSNEAVALLSRSRAEWVQADFAILSAGCVTVPIYPSYTPGQIAWIVNDAEARTLIVEDGAQLAKALEVREKMPGLDSIVVIESGEGHVPPILTFAELRARGRQSAERLTPSLVERVAAITPESVATIAYTSGTTGEPKGVVQTHGNHAAALRALAQIPGVEPGDVHVLFLPLAHAFARLEAYLGVHRGLVTAFAESLERVADNLREVRPHFIFAVPRVFEKVHARIVGDVGAASAVRRSVFRWAMRVGARVSRLQQARQPLPRGLALQRTVAHRLVFAKLRDAFGGRLRFAVSGGAPLPREIAEFFHAAGILIVEGYGLTETCPVLTFNRLDAFRFGSVGQRLPGVELRLAADGEILARGPNVATRGYWRQPAASAEAFDPEGWFHTGDLGRIDGDGFLYITDRKKDLIVTSGGINLAPQHVENLLETEPFIGQAMVYGDRRPYPIALVTLDSGELVRFARERGILVGDPAALARHPAVVERVARIVDATNMQLPSYARIKKFAVLPAELSEGAGELTPTQKVRRRSVAAKYQATIDALYRE